MSRIDKNEAQRQALECLFKLCVKQTLAPTRMRMDSIKMLSEDILRNLEFYRWLNGRRR